LEKTKRKSNSGFSGMRLETRAKVSGFLLALPTIFWLSVFFLLPLVSILGFSFMSRGAGGAPVWPLTLDNYDDAIFGIYGGVLFRSIRISFISTIACLLLGYPLAFYIGTRRNDWVKNVTLFLVILPFWTNFLVRTYAWRILMGQEGVINSVLLNIQNFLLGNGIDFQNGLLGIDNFFHGLGLNFVNFSGALPQLPLPLLNTEFAVIIGLIYAYLPFMVLPIYASVERFNFRYVEAAHDLGANDWWSFWRVVFPLTLPGVFAGVALVFIPVVGAYVTPDMLGGTSGLMIGNLIENQYLGNGNVPRGAALSVVMMGVVMFTLLIYVWREKLMASSSRTKLTLAVILITIVNAFAPNPYLLVFMMFSLLAIIWWDWIRQQRSYFKAGLFAVGIGLLYPLITDPWQQGVLQFLLIIAVLGMIISGIWAIITRNQPPVPKEALDLHSPARISRDKWLRRLGTWGLYFNPIFSYFFLWAPIVILVIFSFNESRSVSVFTGVTLKWYQNLFSGVVGTEVNFTTGELLESLQASLLVAAVATVFSTTFGTLVAIGLSRSEFPGKGILDGIMFLPVVIPEITQGISLAIFFNLIFEWLNTISGTRLTTGFGTIIIGHIAFNISFVAIVVRARLADMNPRYEEAARDLGANNWETFRRVTFPLILPGIIAGGLLAFTLSLDDYVITLFTSGVGTTTLPIFVYGLLKLSVTPEINAISTLLLVFSTILIGISLLLQGRNAAKV
jgi:spermidine/putrescine transport system permease protein